MATTEMTGGYALAETLERHNVGPMFGMAGFRLPPFYDAMLHFDTSVAV